MRHEVNNHLSLMVASMEMARFRPELRERHDDHAAEQMPKIQEEMARFTADFEQALGFSDENPHFLDRGRNLSRRARVWFGMKKLSLLYLAAGLLLLGRSRPARGRHQQSPRHGQQTGAAPRIDNAKYMQIIGLKREDLKGLTPEDRRAKIKDATEKKVAELQQKKSGRHADRPGEVRPRPLAETRAARHQAQAGRAITGRARRS